MGCIPPTLLIQQLLLSYSFSYKSSKAMEEKPNAGRRDTDTR